MTQTSFSQATLRTNEYERGKRAMDIIRDHAVFADAAVARWISSAPRRQNRRRALTFVLGLQAARVQHSETIKQLGASAAAVKNWRLQIDARRRADPDFNAAIAEAIEDANCFGAGRKPSVLSRSL